MTQQIKDNIKLFICFLCVAITVITLSFMFANSVHAEEITEETEEYDDDDRLNAIEIRLEELGYKISDTENDIEVIQAVLEENEEEKLTINEKMEIMIVGMSHLLDATTDSVNLQIAVGNAVDTMQKQAMMYFEKKEETDKNITDLTVSGNTILSDFDNNVSNKIDNVSAQSMEEFNKTLLSTNKLLSYLFILLLFVLVGMIVTFIGSIIKSITNKIVD